MVNSLMPSWALVLLTVAYLVVLAVHVRHLLEVRGVARLWHSTHVLMALGMVNMAAPTAWTGLSGMPVNATLAACAFAVLVGFCACASGLAVQHADRTALLWAIAAVGAAGMAWMYLYTDRGGWYTAGTVAFALWFLAEAILWVTGSLISRMHGLEAEPSAGTAASSAPATEPPAATGGGVRGAVATAPTQVREGTRPVHEHSRIARVTLAVMALGMAWMLLAMEFGIADVSGVASTGGAGHHH